MRDSLRLWHEAPRNMAAVCAAHSSIYVQTFTATFTIYQTLNSTTE
jgi:hypothetical protein